MSNVGDGLFLVALPLLAATLTRSPLLVAGVLVSSKLPWLFLALPAGVLADRLPRARTMARVDLARGAVMGALTLAVALDALALPMLYLAAFTLGALETLFAASSQAVLPSMVDGEVLDRANGYLYASEATGEQFIGPALGGVVFAASRALPFVADTATFLLSGVLLLKLGKGRPAHGVRPPTVPPSSVRKEMAEGIDFLRRSPILRTLAFLISGLAFCQAMVMSVFVLFALEVLDLSGAGFGAFLALGATGGIAGGLVAGWGKDRFGPARMLTLGALVAAASYVVIASTSSVAVAAIGLVIESFAIACGTIVSIGLRQANVPGQLLGRVSNVIRTCVWGVVPLGAGIGGVLGSIAGLRTPLVVAGVLQVVLAFGTMTKLRQLTYTNTPYREYHGE